MMLVRICENAQCRDAELAEVKEEATLDRIPSL
jgi:hypothetical protein